MKPFIIPVFIVFISLTACQSNRPHTINEILTTGSLAPLTDSIEQFPDRDDLYFKRAILLNNQNEVELALADFEKAWHLNKKEQYALGIGNLLLEKNAEEAAAFFKSAIVNFPNTILLRSGLARALAFQNKTDSSLLLIEQVLQMDSSQISIRIIQADLLEKKKQPQIALQILEQAYQKAPDNEQLAYHLALKYAETKNSKAITLSDSLILHHNIEKKAAPYYYKGIYYANMHQHETAIHQFNEAIKTDYHFKEAYIEKGRVFFNQEKYNEARQVFNLVATLSPQFPDAYYWIAKCQEKTGDKQEAKLNYLRAFGLDKNFIEAKEAAEKIAY